MPEENNQIIASLKALPIFSEMQDSDIANILSVAVLQFFPGNYFVMRENEPGDFMCIIKKGQVEIFKGSDEIGTQKTELAVLADGEVFGEMALISSRPRNASCRTIDDAEIFILKKADFDKFLQENSSLASKISHEVIERMKKNESTETV